MNDIAAAIKAICEEKGLSYDAVLTTIESALAAAYRKDYGKKNQNIVVKFDPEVGKSKVFDIKEVVEDMPEEEESDEDAKEEKDAKEESKEKKKDKKEDDKKKDKKKEEKKDEKKLLSAEAGEDEEEERKFNPKTEMQISDAKLIKKTAKIGDEIKTKLEVPEEYGRMAAQTAKQVIIQRLREAEREMIFNDFKEKEHEVISGVVQRREGKVVLIDLGKSVGILTSEEQIYGEQYQSGDRIKIFVKEVNLKPKGPEILLSRTTDEILKKVFYLEIPEISNGLIELKRVAREAGFRSKVAVWSDSDNVDPIGSCVGQRGARIQTIINELGGEKVDIIQYDEDDVKFISNALSPAKITNIELNEEEKKAVVSVSGDQLSLAIGKGGQNASLAAKLTGWKIDITEIKEEVKDDNKKEKESEEKKEEKDDKKDKKDDKKKKDKNADKEEKTDKKSDKKKEKDEKKKEDKKEKKKNKKNKTDKKTDKEEKKKKKEEKDPSASSPQSDSGQAEEKKDKKEKKS